jgi:tripartite-type tricarboxylate transporter receptor subunit TctC
MKLRIIVGWLCLIVSILPVDSYAQSAWPNAPMRIITPTPAGVGTDVFARIYASNLAKVLNTAAYVENRPGASATIAAAAVAKASPNGLTVLLSISLPLTTAPALFSKLPYDAGKDFAPVAQLYRGGSFLIANNSFAGSSLADDRTPSPLTMLFSLHTKRREFITLIGGGRLRSKWSRTWNRDK